MQRRADRGRPRSSGQGRQGLFFVLLGMVHAEVARRFEPVLVHLDSRTPEAPRAREVSSLIGRGVTF
jgi:hypothetical protein